MIKVENHEVTMFGELEELSAEITLLMATHYQANEKRPCKTLLRKGRTTQISIIG